jgi:hypothetical protein
VDDEIRIETMEAGGWRLERWRRAEDAASREQQPVAEEVTPL